MRILWFSVTPSLFNPHTNSHNGGGWIASLEQLVRNDPSVQLGIAFNFEDDGFRHERDGVAYYPIPSIKMSKFRRLLAGGDNSEARMEQCNRIIRDFKPDLIQIFGSENDFGLICDRTDIPVVIHIQGSMPPYHNALFPVGMNTFDFYSKRGLDWHNRLMGVRSEQSFRKRAEREIGIMKSCRYFMGRTEWDKALVHLFNPQAKYFHCNEALRDSFIQNGAAWKGENGPKFRIVSVISRPWYKGVDLILKTANLLKRHTDWDYEWNVYGVNDIRFFESKYGIKAADVNVRINGTVNKNDLIRILSSASCYVHPSYIDNSPNSVCEAQYIGIPVLATYVGGIPSLVEHGKTGMLFPANDPYTLVSLLDRIRGDRDLAEALSRNEREASRMRHDPETIRKQLLSIYNQILAQ